MSDTLRTVIGPALALVGTLAAAFLGYRQWRKQQDLARYGGFLSERQAAYKELWQKLEDVHLHIRSQEFQEETFHGLVRVANSHLIKTSLYLDTGEKKRVNDYLTTLGNLGRLLSGRAATDAKAEAQQSFYDTAAFRALPAFFPRLMRSQAVGFSRGGWTARNSSAKRWL